MYALVVIVNRQAMRCLRRPLHSNKSKAMTILGPTSKHTIREPNGTTVLTTYLPLQYPDPSREPETQAETYG